MLGDYVAIGTQNGRYLYQQKDEDRFLEYGDRYWIVSTGVIQSNPMTTTSYLPGWQEQRASEPSWRERVP